MECGEGDGQWREGFARIAGRACELHLGPAAAVRKVLELEAFFLGVVVLLQAARGVAFSDVRKSFECIG